MMRRYFPRSCNSLLKFKVIILSDVRLNLLTTEKVGWMADGVTDTGLGLAMIGGLDSFEGTEGNSWSNSPLGPILPVSGGRGIWSSATLRTLDETDPFITNLPFARIGEHGEFSGYNDVVAEPGSRVIGTIMTELGEKPLMVYWDVGKGICFTFTSEWKGNCVPAFCRILEECHQGGTRWGDSFCTWEYFPDFARNLIYLLADRPIPKDFWIAHLFEQKLQEFQLKKSLAFSLIEFLDRLDISFAKLEVMMKEADLEIEEAKALYVDGNLDDCLAKADLGLDKLSDLATYTSELKKNSLLWLHASQYAAVLAAVLLVVLVTESLISQRAKNSTDSGRKVQE